MDYELELIDKRHQHDSTVHVIILHLLASADLLHSSNLQNQCSYLRTIKLMNNTDISSSCKKSLLYCYRTSCIWNGVWLNVKPYLSKYRYMYII